MNYPLTNIHPEARIGQNVVIEPFTTIGKDVVIGDNSWIGPNVAIMDGARIGKNCKVFPGAVVSAPPQDLKYRGEPSTTVVGNNTTIRECVTLNRGTELDKNTTVIGENCLIMAYVHVGHDCIIGNNVIIANSVQLAGHIDVEDFVYIAGVSAVHQFVKIGAHSMVAGGSLVRKDVPPYTKAGREPLSYCGINSVGLKRRGFSNEKINEIQDIYRNIFLKGLNVGKAIDLVELEMPSSKERDEIINFIRSSERGIMKGFNE